MALFPRDVKRAVLPGGSFAFLEAGPEAGALALCLHGFPDHPRTFEPLLGPLLEAGYRVVAPWMRGYAPSVKEGPYHGPRLGQDAVELAGALSPDRPVLLIGHDWGAVAGWHAAALAPKRFQTLVAMSVPHPAAFARNLRRHPQQLLRMWYVAAFQVPFLAERIVAAADFEAIARTYLAEDGALPPYWDELKETLRASLPAPLGYYRALRRRPSLPPRICVATLHLTGARDPAIAPEMGTGQERFVEARFASEVLEAKHFLHHQLPAEVAARILGFAAK